MKSPGFILPLLLAVTITVVAQKKVSPPPVLFQFNLDIARLPANFRGHYDQLLHLYSARSFVTAKGEFESSWEYELRMVEIERIMLNRLGPGPFAVAVTPEITFDADEEAFEIVGRFDFHRLLVRAKQRAGKSYIGQNAFGVKKRIQVRAYDNYYVQVENRSEMPSDVGAGNIGNIEMRLTMPRPAAIKSKAGLRMLLIGQPAHPFFSQHTAERTPTITEPEHSATYTLVVHMDISAIWLFDYPTGHIWAKWEAPNRDVSIARTKIPGPARETVAETPSIEPLVQGRDGVSRVQILFKDRAQYTPEARKAGIQGTVVLRVLFTADGTVESPRVIRGLPLGLTESAIEAAKRVRFKPATKNGKAVTIEGQLEYTFNLF